MEAKDTIAIVCSSLALIISLVSLYRTRETEEKNQKNAILRRFTEYVNEALPVLDDLKDEMLQISKYMKSQELKIDVSNHPNIEILKDHFAMQKLLHLNLYVESLRLYAEVDKIIDGDAPEAYEDLEKEFVKLAKLRGLLNRNFKEMKESLSVLDE
jgi:hypothetical protein